jgi:hypothetical protein
MYKMCSMKKSCRWVAGDPRSPPIPDIDNSNCPLVCTVGCSFPYVHFTGVPPVIQQSMKVTKPDASTAAYCNAGSRCTLTVKTTSTISNSQSVALTGGFSPEIIKGLGFGLEVTITGTKTIASGKEFSTSLDVPLNKSGNYFVAFSAMSRITKGIIEMRKVTTEDCQVESDPAHPNNGDVTFYEPQLASNGELDGSFVICEGTDVFLWGDGLSNCTTAGDALPNNSGQTGQTPQTVTTISIIPTSTTTVHNKTTSIPTTKPKKPKTPKNPKNTRNKPKKPKKAKH